MIDAAAVTATAAIYAAGVVIPGPNFISVTHRAMADGRRAALLMATGIVSVNLLWATSAILGIAIVLQSHPVMATVLRWLGSAYLLWLAYRIATRDATPRPMARHGAHARNPYLAGIFINLSNPESMLYYTSVFASAVVARPSLPTLLAMVATVGLVGLLWYGSIGMILSTDRVATSYKRIARVLNVCASLCIVIMCVRNLVLRS
jgi:threonine/homoserine/homoserine lactone efflux protein